MDPDQKFIRIQQLCGSGSTQVKIGWNRGKRSQIEDKNWKFYIKSFPLIIYLLHFSIVDKITTGSGSKLGQNSGSGSKFNALYLDPQRCFKQREKTSLRIFLQHLINRLKWFWWKIHFHGYIWEISDSTQTNTAWSFAGINVVFAGLCLPCKRIKKVLLHICELFQHRPAFSVTFSMD